MITRPAHTNPFQFVVTASLRAQQLLAGSVPRLPGEFTPVTMAQMEVATGSVSPIPSDAAPQPVQCHWQI